MFDIIFLAASLLFSIILSLLVELHIRKIENKTKKRLQSPERDICDSCGSSPKAPNSQICKECQEKVYED